MKRRLTVLCALLAALLLVPAAPASALRAARANVTPTRSTQYAQLVYSRRRGTSFG